MLPKTNADLVVPFAIGIADDLMLRLPEERWPDLRCRLQRHCNSRPISSASPPTAPGGMTSKKTQSWRKATSTGSPPPSDCSRSPSTILRAATSFAWLISGAASAPPFADPLWSPSLTSGRVGQGGRPILSLKQW
jgi:hypothetical protein